MAKLSGKVALVTGGNSGIGLATAAEFKAQGAKVVISGRDAIALKKAAEELGDGVLSVQADVTRLEDLKQLFETTQAEFGPLDVLFVNAGIARMGNIEAVTPEVFDEVMNTNFKGVFFTIQQALPYLNPNASIILNGSVNAHVGFAGASVYSASKAAVHSLARTLTPELIERGIRINTINIGPIETPLYGKLGLPQDMLQGFAGAVVGKLAVKRFGRPEEVAKVAAFLASDDSSFVVGAEITTDGGLLVNSL